MAKIRIVVVDDHEVVRHGLRLSLELEPDMALIGEARTGEEALTIVADGRPDVVLLDVRLEGADGPEVCRRILEVAPRTAVVMLTNYDQDGFVLRSLMAGAKGYVIKDVQLSELKKMIRSVYRGGSVLDPKVTGQVISTVALAVDAPVVRPGGPRQVTTLSDTDLTILRHLAEGLTDKQIAGRVHLSPHTVKDHLEKIRAVLDVGSRTEIVATALRRGLV
ncbi:MAG TPA: response regulator transcription factor [Methylomirabilota bacterium]|nr:response regulator transcription factor [Methylomirabilota bacterium]